jgi:excisionase family DNA binding protein
MNDTNATDPWLTPDQAADYAMVSRRYLNSQMRSGALKFSRLSHKVVRIRQSWVDKWIDAHASSRR